MRIVDVSLMYPPSVPMWLYTALANARELGATDDTYFLWKLYRLAVQGGPPIRIYSHAW